VLSLLAEVLLQKVVASINTSIINKYHWHYFKYRFPYLTFTQAAAAGVRDVLQSGSVLLLRILGKYLVKMRRCIDN
jgi:hypothetical protein